MTREERARLRALCEDAPEKVEHRAGCPTIADDESDYEYLSDAGVCTCGAHFAAAARTALPALLDAQDRVDALAEELDRDALFLGVVLDAIRSGRAVEQDVAQARNRVRERAAALRRALEVER